MLAQLSRSAPDQRRMLGMCRDKAAVKALTSIVPIPDVLRFQAGITAVATSRPVTR